MYSDTEVLRRLAALQTGEYKMRGGFLTSRGWVMAERNPKREETSLLWTSNRTHHSVMANQRPQSLIISFDGKLRMYLRAYVTMHIVWACALAAGQPERGGAAEYASAMWFARWLDKWLVKSPAKT